MEEQTQTRTGAMTVYRFLNKGAAKQLTLPEFTAFWKDLHPDDKARFVAEATTLSES